MKLFNAQCIEIILDQIAIVIFKDEYTGAVEPVQNWVRKSLSP